MKEIVEKYKKEIEEIDKMMPWKEIAISSVFKKEPEKWLEMVVIEYELLVKEVEGMEKFPEAWKGLETHPQTHIKALKSLLKMRR